MTPSLDQTCFSSLFIIPILFSIPASFFQTSQKPPMPLYQKFNVGCHFGQSRPHRWECLDKIFTVERPRTAWNCEVIVLKKALWGFSTSSLYSWVPISGMSRRTAFFLIWIFDTFGQIIVVVESSWEIYKWKFLEVLIIWVLRARIVVTLDDNLWLLYILTFNSFFPQTFFF